MVQFILTTILMASLGTMLYLVARSLPRVGEEVSDKKSFLDRLSTFKRTTFSFLKYLRRKTLKVVSILSGISEEDKRSRKLFLSETSSPTRGSERATR